ncbi:MAG: acyl-CoA dehydrogenase, partial [Spirochaetes bacterium]|nr:acyl-CoA dehydrogenase [Spirochaetota bacterium]
MYTVNREADKIGVRYDPQNKRVIIPEILKAPLKKFNEAGFVGIMEEAEVGGMGMPFTIVIACNEVFTAAS